MICWFGAKKGQNKGPVSKTRARITSLSSGQRYALPLNSSVMQNREVQNPKAKPDLAGSRIREIWFCGLFFWVVVSVGGFEACKRWR